ncbi:MAG: class I SAM-dependent methyltransferase [Nocardiopsaceae bacterium]|nr:class I SAM-dependent methyltransferase [Nocardiopsaceae bacterium]
MTQLRRRNPLAAIGEGGMALSMTAGRGQVARAVVGEAKLTDHDRAADVGCGPGTAVRVAAARGVPVTGIDPSPVALRLARMLSRNFPDGQLTWSVGSAEHLPLPDGAVTVIWSISSVHHWADPAAGCAEIYRVLAPAGRVLLAERLLSPGSSGHGSSKERSDELCRTLTSTGFTAVSSHTITTGRRKRIIMRGERPPR